MRLSETDRGLRWLENFLIEDIGIARLLLDSVRVVSESTYRARLTERIYQVVSESESPIALYPVRPRPQSDQEWIEPQPDRPYEASAGSELLVAEILRDVAQDSRFNTTVENIPNLERMRSARFRTVILVDDYAGSGDRSLAYIKAWVRNPTIRSWKSYGLICFKFVSYAISARAANVLEEDGNITLPLCWVESGVDIDTAPWKELEREEVRNLCFRYAGRKKWAFGWKGTGSLFARSHVPNNVPAVLLQRHGPSGPWYPFFSGRSMDYEQQLELGDVSPTISYLSRAELIHQKRLGRVLEQLPDDPRRLLLLIMASLSQGHKTSEQLAEKLGFPLYEVHGCLQWALALQIVDSANRLTDLGWQELRLAREQVARPSFLTHGSDDPYYPRSLRGVR